MITRALIRLAIEAVWLVLWLVLWIGKNSPLDRALKRSTRNASRVVILKYLFITKFFFPVLDQVYSTSREVGRPLSHLQDTEVFFYVTTRQLILRSSSHLICRLFFSFKPDEFKKIIQVITWPDGCCPRECSSWGWRHVIWACHALLAHWA